MDVGIGFQDQEFVHVYAARLGDTAQIVALQIDEHDMFGAFLGVAREPLRQRLL